MLFLNSDILVMRINLWAISIEKNVSHDNKTVIITANGD